MWVWVGVRVGVGALGYRGVGSGRGSTLRTCGAQWQSARGAAELISCDEVRSASPARWRARPDWPSVCAPG